MSPLEIIALFFCGITLLSNFLLWLFFFRKEAPALQAKAWPSVSVLVAARNEEKNLPACLEGLLAQHYPGALEILVGNDKSTDGTLEVARSYAKAEGPLKVMDIRDNLGSAHGKSNVLAQLARKAGGEYLLITDADMRHPADWAKNMVLKALQGYDLVTGFTVVNGRGLFASFQRIDWTLALGMVKVASDGGLGVTAMGNNMLISQKAYRSTGGYEKLPFTITEDFQLYREVRKKGGKTLNTVCPEVKAYTEPAVDFVGLLHQRKRWMRGAVQLPVLMVTLLAIQALFFPAMILGLLLDPGLFSLLWGLKLLVQSAFILRIARRAGEKEKLWQVLLYECYSAMLSLSLLLFYLLPVPVRWKGRKYT
jgi:cellulose synthase/poly-beta-1,6-N-acetylglucosamine synthase-like glycosyltransferase